MSKKKSLLPKEDYLRLIKLKKTLINIKEMLNEAKLEAEEIEEEKNKNNNIVIFKRVDE